MQELYEFIFEKPDIRKLKGELLNTTFFKTLTPTEISTISRYLQVRKFRKGERVFYEGDLGQALYVVLKGQVEIAKTTRTKRIVLADLSKGMFFGELALVYDTPRTASAIVKEDTMLVCLFKHDFEKIIGNYPRLGNKLQAIMNNILAQRLTSLIERTSS